MSRGHTITGVMSDACVTHLFPGPQHFADHEKWQFARTARTLALELPGTTCPPMYPFIGATSDFRLQCYSRDAVEIPYDDWRDDMAALEQSLSRYQAKYHDPKGRIKSRTRPTQGLASTGIPLAPWHVATLQDGRNAGIPARLAEMAIQQHTELTGLPAQGVVIGIGPSAAWCAIVYGRVDDGKLLRPIAAGIDGNASVIRVGPGAVMTARLADQGMLDPPMARWIDQRVGSLEARGKSPVDLEIARSLDATIDLHVATHSGHHDIATIESEKARYHELVDEQLAKALGPKRYANWLEAEVLTLSRQVGRLGVDQEALDEILRTAEICPDPAFGSPEPQQEESATKRKPPDPQVPEIDL